MKIIVHGEGATDMGVHPPNGEFAPGPMLHILSRAINQIKPDLAFTLSPESVCIKSKSQMKEDSNRLYPRKAMFIKQSSPESLKKGNPDHRKLSSVLGKLAIEGCFNLAVFFRDCDGTRSSAINRWEVICQSIMTGFNATGYKYGVPMCPKPTSEAWLLALHPQNTISAAKIEALSGNLESVNHPKKKLKALGTKSIDYTGIVISRFTSASSLSSLNSYQEFYKALHHALSR